MPISFVSTGSFKNTEKFLSFMSRFNIRDILDKYGQQGVDALAGETPVRTGLTAESWRYEVTGSHGNYKIEWLNSHVHEGVPIAILIQYGHGTGTGGYIQGYDFINPAMRPIFDQIASEVWKAVTSA